MEPLEQRLASIESRISRIETSLKLSSPVVEPEPSVPTYHKPQPEPVIEAKPGNWLAIIAVVCFVLAAGFIVKLSIETGWLTPGRQLGLATLLGMGLIGIGLALLQSDRTYASFLPGAGVIIFYLTVFAAHRYYQLISFETAIALTSVVSAICMWLFTEIRHDVYAITAAAGAYVAPAILGLHAGALFSLYYFLLCSIAFATISVWVQSRALTLVSSYLAILMSSFIGIDLGQDTLVAGFLAIHFLAFVTGTYFYTMHNQLPLTASESWSFIPVLLIFYAVEYYLIDRIHPGLAPWTSLAFAAILIGLYLSAKMYFPDSMGSQSLILAFATIVAFHSIYLELLPDGFRPWLFVFIMLAVAFLPFDLSVKEKGSPFRIPALAILAILAIEYVTMLSHLLNERSGAWLIVSFAAFAAIWVVLVFAKDKLAEQPTCGRKLLGAAHLLAVLGLYRLTHEVGSLAVSASWLFYAVAVIVFAFSTKDEVMAKSALFVLAFAAGKALLYDAASAPTIVRIFCLLLTGAVLYGCGLFMRKINDWKVLSDRYSL